MNSEILAYLLITVPANNSGDVAGIITRRPNFLEVERAVGVYGEADVFARVRVESLGKLYDLVMKNVQTLPNVESTRTYIMIPRSRAQANGTDGLGAPSPSGASRAKDVEPASGNPTQQGTRGAVSAYLLITVPASHSDALVSALETPAYPEVQEVGAVYGEADVIARVVTSSLQELRGLVMDRIQHLPNVKVTRTYIEIPETASERASLD